MNKFNKGKMIGVVTAALSTVSLMGVGFATWIITGETSATTNDNITVGVADVQDNRIEITSASVVEGNGGLRFDGDHNKRATSNGVISCGDTDTEQLSFKIRYTVTANNITKGFKVKAYINDDKNDAQSTTASARFQVAENTNKFITMPTILGFTKSTAKEALSFTANGTAPTSSNASGDEITKVGDATNSWEVTQTFTFGWGLAFHNDNPVALVKNTKIYNHNNTNTTESDKMEDATTDLVKNLLDEAKRALDNQKFKVVLMPVVDA